MRIYLDTNIYFRPLDDRTQSRIALEAEASLIILETLEQGKLATYGSDILIYELEQANQLKKSYILPFTKFWKSQIQLSDIIIKEAKLFQKKYKLKSRDALHLAFGISSRSKYLLTCDDEFIAKAKEFAKIRVTNPIDFVREEKL